MLAPGSVLSAMERTLCAPWGLHGGKDALANRFSIVRKDGSMQSFADGKDIGHVALRRGRRLFRGSRRRRRLLESRLERDPERVLADVRAGYVSLEAARRDYGVVIHQNGRKFELDTEATKELRNRDDW